MFKGRASFFRLSYAYIEQDFKDAKSAGEIYIIARSSFGYFDLKGDIFLWEPITRPVNSVVAALFSRNDNFPMDSILCILQPWNAKVPEISSNNWICVPDLYFGPDVTNTKTWCFPIGDQEDVGIHFKRHRKPPTEWNLARETRMGFRTFEEVQKYEANPFNFSSYRLIDIYLRLYVLVYLKMVFQYRRKLKGNPHFDLSLAVGSLLECCCPIATMDS